MSHDMIGALATDLASTDRPFAAPKLFAAFAKPAPAAPDLSAPPQLAPAFAKPQVAFPSGPGAPKLSTAFARPFSQMLATSAARRDGREAAAAKKSEMSWLPWILLGAGVVVAGTGFYVMSGERN